MIKKYKTPKVLSIKDFLYTRLKTVIILYVHYTYKYNIGR